MIPVGGLLERAARALPAAEEERRQGWWLRHTDSSMWWSGAVLAHPADGVVPLEQAITSAEEFYRARGAPARFHVCADCPAALDTALAQRGYRRAGPMSLQVATAAEVANRLPSSSPLTVHVTPHPDPEWFALWRAVSAPDSPAQPEQRLLQRVRHPSAYVTVVDADRAIAVGRAVADNGWTGVFAMATLPTARGRGAGKRVLAAVARWAVSREASRIYLQVEGDNLAAQQLYERAGFSEVTAYHYRLRG